MNSEQEDHSNFAMVELDRVECLELLERAGIGRVVLSVGCIPVALPVNMAILEGDVVFSTTTGSKLDAALGGEVVSVEADGVDRLYRTGWSVLVTGVAQVLTDPTEIERATRLPLQAWAPGPHAFLVRVASTLISGRRLTWGQHRKAGSQP
jgi:nitroimidazol reductase NimA-like FMN-containing flavoprotein (pyridoxamine 5'-phosphate oxidase superfamily)